MGLTSITNRVSAVGDGSSTIFSFPYYFFNQTDLKVYLFDVNSSVVYPQVLSTNYSIAGAQNSAGVFPNGGNVVMNSSFPSSLEIVIVRDPLPVQNFALNQNQAIPSASLVQQYDYLTALVQRLQERVQRCVRMPEGIGPANGSSFSPELPQSLNLTALAGSPLVLNSGATGWTFGLIANGQSGSVSYAGILPVAFGGTGQGLPLNQFGLIYAQNSSLMASMIAGGTNQSVIGVNSGAPAWGQVSIGSGTVVSNGVFGVLPTSNGGLGIGSSFAWPQWGIPYASSATQFAAVQPAAEGLFLMGQQSSAPVWRQVNLGSSAQLSGILQIANGGTAGSSAAQALINLWPAGIARGDLLIVNSGLSVSRLAIGSDNTVFTANSSAGNAAGAFWGSITGALSVVTKTANYVSTQTDDVVLVNSSNLTITLPDATTATKKSYKYINVGSGAVLFNGITLMGSGAQSIGGYGNTVQLWTPNESWELVPDGVNFQVINHKCETAVTPYVPVWQGIAASALANQIMWRRVGNVMMGEGIIHNTAVSGSTLMATLPFNVTINSSALWVSNSSGANGQLIGANRSNGGAGGTGHLLLAPATNNAALFFSGGDNLGGTIFTPQAGNAVSTVFVAASDNQFDFTVPIAGWQP